MPDQSRQEPLAVAAEQLVADVVIKAVPLGAISGKVVDPDGEPLRGVAIHALQYRYVPAGKRLDVAADATTDARGRYRLHSLPPGRYIIRAFLRVTPPGPAGLPGHTHNMIPDEGFLPSWNPGLPESANAPALNVLPAADLTSFDFRLLRTPVFHIRGTLVTTVPQPPRVIAANCSTANLDSAYTFPADRLPENAFSLRGIPPSQYCLAASQSNWRRVSADAVVIVADRDVNGVVLEAPAPAVYEGSVEVDSITPVQLPPLSMLWQDPSQSSCCSAFVAVKNDRTFATRPLPPGSYVVWFSGLPKGFYMKSLQSGEQNIPGNRIEVRPGVGKLRVVLGTDAGQVNGTVQTSDGKPSGSMMVTIAPKGSKAGRFDLIHSARTRPDGSFQFPDMAPGEYSVFAWESFDEKASASPDYLKQFASMAGSVTVGSSETATVQVKAIPAKEAEDALWRSQ